MLMCLSVWQKPEIISWSEILANSFQQLLGRELIANANTPEIMAQALFKAPFALVSHGTQADPVLNYGNQTALHLWSMEWEEFTKIPSHLTAEPINRKIRAQMLEQAAKQGFIDDYQGIRISSTGKRFSIKKAIIWNLTDMSGKKCGQAATFSNWKWI